MIWCLGGRKDLTLLLDKDFGFIVGFSLTFGNGPVSDEDFTPILQGVAADYDIVKGEQVILVENGKEYY